MWHLFVCCFANPRWCYSWKWFLLKVECFRRVGSGFISGKTEILIPEFFSVFRSFFKNLLKCDCNWLQWPLKLDGENAFLRYCILYNLYSCGLFLEKCSSQISEDEPNPEILIFLPDWKCLEEKGCMGIWGGWRHWEELDYT